MLKTLCRTDQAPLFGAIWKWITFITSGVSRKKEGQVGQLHVNDYPVNQAKKLKYLVFVDYGIEDVNGMLPTELGQTE